MRVILISPFRCHFNLNTHHLFFREKEYSGLWRKVEERLDTGGFASSITYRHRDLGNPGMRYQRISEDGSLIPAEIFTAALEPGLIAKLGAAAIKEADAGLEDEEFRGLIEVEEGSAKLWQFENTIGVLGVRVRIDESALGDRLGEFFKAFQTWSNQFKASLTQRLYREHFFPFLLAIWGLDEDQFLQTPGDYLSYPNVSLNPLPEKGARYASESVEAPPLWVNRTLLFDEVSAELRGVLERHWVFAMSDLGPFRSEIEKDDAIWLGWGNNVITEDVDSDRCRDALSSLVLCQYFYAVMDSANNNLSRFVGIAQSDASIKETRALNRKLEEVVNTVNTLLIQYADTQQNLQGHRQVFLKDLIAKWDLGILIENIEKKIGICTQQIERLYETVNSQSAFIMEVILFFIGGLALVDFVKGMSEYATALQESPDTDPTRDGLLGFLDLVLLLPPEGVVWSGVMLLLVSFVIFYLLQRRTQ